MKLTRLVHDVVALLIVAAAGASPAHAGSHYRIITEGEFGFKKGNSFFALKLSGGDFETKFGAAEKKMKHGDGFRLAYLAEGISVLVEDGKIRSLTFVLVPAKTERFQDYQPINATTSSGIRGETSIADVIKIEGEPASKEEYPSLGRTILHYKSRGQEYAFTFKDGALAQIELKASRA
jgi:hypothetical protein